MGIWNRLMSWVEMSARHWRSADAAPGDQQPSGRRRRGDAGSQVMAGMIGGAAGQAYPGGWTQDRLELVSHYRHWTYVAVRAICNEIAGLTPRVALVRSDSAGNGYQKDWLPWIKKSTGAVGEHEEVIEVGDGHPLCALFRQPNSWDVACDLWFELVLFLELTGHGYVWCVPNRAGFPCQLWVIPSHWVWRKMGPSGVLYYEVRPLLGGGTFRFPPEEIIELRYKSPVHKIDGWSPQQAGAEWIDAAESIDKSRFYQFENGCFPIGAVELGEGYHDPDDAEMERIYAKFFARLMGVQNYGRPIITPPGAKYNPLSISPAEMAYVDSADQLRDWTLALYGVPKEVAGIQDAGSEIAMYGPLLQFGRLTILPRLRYLGQCLTRHLARRYHPDLRIWWEYELPVSPQQTNADLTVDAANGWIMPNEARAVRGRRPYTPEEEERYANPSTTVPRGTRPLGGAAGGSGFPQAPKVHVADRTKGGFREDDHPRAADGRFDGGGEGRPSSHQSPRLTAPQREAAREAADAALGRRRDREDDRLRKRRDREDEANYAANMRLADREHSRIERALERESDKLPIDPETEDWTDATLARYVEMRDSAEAIYEEWYAKKEKEWDAEYEKIRAARRAEDEAIQKARDDEDERERHRRDAEDDAEYDRDVEDEAREAGEEDEEEEEGRTKAHTTNGRH